MENEETRILGLLYTAREALILDKPVERGELARGYAVTITELEKVIGYFKTFVIPMNDQIMEGKHDNGQTDRAK